MVVYEFISTSNGPSLIQLAQNMIDLVPAHADGLLFLADHG